MNRKEYLIEWRKNNKNKVKEKNHEYYEKNKFLLSQKNKVRWNKNKLQYSKTNKIWRETNKNYLSKKHKDWYQQNKDIYNKKRRELSRGTFKQSYEKRKEYFKNYQRKKRKNNLLYRLNSNISRRIRKDLKRFNITKKESTQKLLPYTMQELKEHIEKQFTPEMNWDNMGVVFEIDHSTPVAWAKNEKELLELWSLKNLRPLLKKENREKQDLFSGNVSNTLSSIGR